MALSFFYQITDSKGILYPGYSFWPKRPKQVLSLLKFDVEGIPDIMARVTVVPVTNFNLWKPCTTLYVSLAYVLPVTLTPDCNTLKMYPKTSKNWMGLWPYWCVWSCLFIYFYIITVFVGAFIAFWWTSPTWLFSHAKKGMPSLKRLYIYNVLQRLIFKRTEFREVHGLFFLSFWHPDIDKVRPILRTCWR